MSPHEVERQKHIKALDYCKNALTFIHKLESATAEMQNLLLSKSTSDVLEALRFLSKAHRFGIPGAQSGIRASLVLVWDQRDTGTVRRELLESIERLYMLSSKSNGDDAGDEGEQAQHSTV
jgi:hypothetical protein